MPARQIKHLKQKKREILVYDSYYSFACHQRLNLSNFRMRETGLVSIAFSSAQCKKMGEEKHLVLKVPGPRCGKYEVGVVEHPNLQFDETINGKIEFWLPVRIYSSFSK